MIDEANTVIRGLVRTVMGMPANSVRPADQIIPAGGQIAEFATVKVISSSDIGWLQPGSIDHLDGSTTETITGPKRVVASIQFFRSAAHDDAGIAKYSNAAFDRAARLLARLQLSSSIGLMAKAGLGFLGASDVRNLAALVDATWESRAQVDLTFDFMARETAPIATILSVPLSVALQGSDGTRQTRITEVTQ